MLHEGYHNLDNFRHYSVGVTDGKELRRMIYTPSFINVGSRTEG
jgi:hypothetical protein